MKSYKWMTLVCLAVLMLGGFAGCSSSEGGTSAASETETAAQAMRTVEQRYEPKMDAARRQKLLRGWDKAVGRSLNWAEPEP